MACPLLGLSPLFLLGGVDMNYDKEVSTDHTCECGQVMELSFREDGIYWSCSSCGNLEKIK